MNNSSNDKTVAPEGLPPVPCSPPFDDGLRPAPTTKSFEQWWVDHGGKCEDLFSKLGIKAAVERGFFAGYESSDSTFIQKEGK